MSNEKFEQDMKRGDVGEDVAIKYLESVGWSTFNVSKVKHFQEQDIDIIAFRGEEYLTVEVKTDSVISRTGNVFYEFTTSGHIGCFEKTKAMFIFIYDDVNDILFSIWTDRIQNYVKNNLSTLQYGIVRGGDASKGFKLPVEELIKEKIMAVVRRTK